MPNAKQQYVYLVPQRDAQNVISWFWLYNGQSGPASNFPVIEAKKNGGAHDIYFTVFDPQNAIKFAGYDGPNPAQAIGIAVKPATGQKPKSGIVTGGEIKNVSYDQDGAQLLLDNTNKKDVTLVYTLNFVDSSNNNQPVTAIDPELKNGGGGTGADTLTTVSLVIAGVLLGALISVLIVRYAMGWRPR